MVVALSISRILAYSWTITISFCLASRYLIRGEYGTREVLFYHGECHIYVEGSTELPKFCLYFMAEDKCGYKIRINYVTGFNFDKLENFIKEGITFDSS